MVEPSQDAVKAALAEFLVDPKWPVERRAKLAAEIHSRFSWDTVGPPYVRLYEDVLRHA